MMVFFLVLLMGLVLTFFIFLRLFLIIFTLFFIGIYLSLIRWTSDFLIISIWFLWSLLVFHLILLLSVLFLFLLFLFRIRLLHVLSFILFFVLLSCLWFLLFLLIIIFDFIFLLIFTFFLFLIFDVLLHLLFKLFDLFLLIFRAWLNISFALKHLFIWLKSQISNDVWFLSGQFDMLFIFNILIDIMIVNNFNFVVNMKFWKSLSHVVNSAH